MPYEIGRHASRLETVVGHVAHGTSCESRNHSPAAASPRPQTDYHAHIVDEQTRLHHPCPTNHLADSRPTARFSRWRPDLAIRTEAARQSDGNGCWGAVRDRRTELRTTKLLAHSSVAIPRTRLPRPLSRRADSAAPPHPTNRLADPAQKTISAYSLKAIYLNVLTLNVLYTGPTAPLAGPGYPTTSHALWARYIADSDVGYKTCAATPTTYSVITTSSARLTRHCHCVNCAVYRTMHFAPYAGRRFSQFSGSSLHVTHFPSLCPAQRQASVAGGNPLHIRAQLTPRSTGRIVGRRPPQAAQPSACPSPTGTAHRPTVGITRLRRAQRGASRVHAGVGRSTGFHAGYSVLKKPDVIVWFPLSSNARTSSS